MKTRFSKKIAKEIAEKNFDNTLDCIFGRCDPYYDFSSHIELFEQNFTEDLEEKNIIVTPKRITIINTIYEAKVKKALEVIKKLYSKEAHKLNNQP